MVITQRQFNDAMEQVNKAFSDLNKKNAELLARIEKLETQEKPRPTLTRPSNNG